MKKLLKISSVLAIGVGIILVFGGFWAVLFTYNNVARENIVTTEDASIPNSPVRGPFTLKAQADIIRDHILKKTDGKTYSQMAREDEKRNLWITATTLTTALHLGVITYLFSGLIMLFGCVSMWTGIVFHALSKKYS
ncbi:MAG: hypothetical protein AAB649_01185 [Patescibacteria group bacterium]